MNRLALTLLPLLLALAPPARSEGPVPPLRPELNERVERVPVGAGPFTVRLETTIFRPPGAGPFPVVVISHGKASGNTKFQERARYLAATREFLRRGYLVVVPMRSGFAGSEGKYIDYGCNLEGNGQHQADDVAGVLAWLASLPEADTQRVLLVGQSHGGLTTLALGSRNPPGVRGMLNFAGGLRMERCEWEGPLAEAIARYGASTRIPSLWFYGDNDSYWGAELPRTLHARYQRAGGQAQLVAYGNFRSDAHGLFSSRQGVAIWWPPTERFLAELGLPTALVHDLPEAPRQPPTRFATLEEVDAVPRLGETGRAGYRSFLAKPAPRAFAIGPAGAWGWASDGDDPTWRALANCQKHSKDPCRLYAVDDDVVWAPAAAQAR